MKQSTVFYKSRSSQDQVKMRPKMHTFLTFPGKIKKLQS